MPGITVVGDLCSGHECYPPRTCDEGSSDVFCGGLGINRVGDHWVTHCCNTSCHDGVLVSGSGGVFCNGQAVGRIGDPISCGSVVAQGGTSKVFCG